MTVKTKQASKQQEAPGNARAAISHLRSLQYAVKDAATDVESHLARLEQEQARLDQSLQEARAHHLSAVAEIDREQGDGHAADVKAVTDEAEAQEREIAELQQLLGFAVDIIEEKE